VILSLELRGLSQDIYTLLVVLLVFMNGSVTDCLSVHIVLWEGDEYYVRTILS